MPKEAEGSCKGDPLKAEKEDGKGRGAAKSPASLHIYIYLKNSL